MTLSELATIVENKIPVKIALMNNHVLGMVHQWQHLFYKDTFYATEYSGNPDFVKLADAFGAKGVRLNSIDDFKPALKDAMTADTLTLIEFPITLNPPGTR